MLWWMWIVLWVALIAVGLIFLVVVGFRVFRRGMRTVGEFGEALDRLEMNIPSGGDAVEHHPGFPGIPVPAVFSTPRDVRAARELAKTRRTDNRRSSRIRKRADRRQPQLLRDMPHL